MSSSITTFGVLQDRSWKSAVGDLHSDGDEEVARTHPVDDARIVDYDAKGQVVGVEILGASAGIDLRDLPERERLEAEARFLNFPIFA